MQYLAPRFVAMRDGLSELPGVTIIADIAPSPVTEEGGFATMNTILEANAKSRRRARRRRRGARRAARRCARRARTGPTSSSAASTASRTRSPKSRRATAPTRRASRCPRRSSAMPWGSTQPTGCEGKSVPQAMDILPIALTHENIASYEADLADPGAGVRRSGAPRHLPQDVRQHLLRQPRPVREFPVVVGDQIDPARPL